jgi:saccharopine dehydrogenase (NAD+, L-lysine-forming)
MNETYGKLTGPLLVYGAYGKTGSLVAKAAVKRGHEVVLAGSDRDRLDRLSGELGIRGAQAKLDAPLALRQLVRKAACVIHVAGPFSTTFRPMLEACSAEGIPYVDLNGELDVFRAMEDFVDQNRPGIPVVSGAGFGVAAGESAAMHAAGMVEKPERVWLGLAPDLGQRSPGALRSTLRTVARGGAVVKDGRFLPERVGRHVFRATLSAQKRTFISMPLGELWAIRRSTGVASAIGGAAVPAAERILLQSGALGVLAQSERVRNWLAKRLAQDSVRGTPTFESMVWARAEDREGRSAEAILTMGEGYQWSAEAAVRAAERVVLDRRPGLWTPGQYFGKEFAVAVPSTKLIELGGGH